MLISRFVSYCKINPAIIIEKILAICLFISLILTSKLWVSDRSYPLAPIFEFTQMIPNWVHFGMYILLLSAVSGSIIRSNQLWIKFSIVFLLISLLSLDQNRWIQFFPHALMFYIFSIVAPPNRVPRQYITLILIALSGTYFWSGFYKINYRFIEETLPWLLEVYPLVIPKSILNIFGYTTGPTEAILGLLLIFPRFRSFAAAGLIIMHLFILACIGPLGHNWNCQVWGWNIGFMIIFLIIIFSDLKDKIFIKKSENFISVLPFCLLPALNMIGGWDDQLSMTMYSGNSAEGVLSIPEDLIKSMPYLPDKDLLKSDLEPGALVILQDWAIHELNVPNYKAMRVQFMTFRAICSRFNNDARIKMIIFEKDTLFWRNNLIYLSTCPGYRFISVELDLNRQELINGGESIENKIKS